MPVHSAGTDGLQVGWGGVGWGEGGGGMGGWGHTFSYAQHKKHRENSDSKPLFDKDCSLGSVQTRLTTSPCQAIE